jgi:hypothetical protein
VPERKLGFFVKIKGKSAGQQIWTAVKLPARARGMDAPSQHENFNHRNTGSISRINPPKFGGGLKFESDSDIGEKDSFRSGTRYHYNC